MSFSDVSALRWRHIDQGGLRCAPQAGAQRRDLRCLRYDTTEPSRIVFYCQIKSRAEDPDALDKFGDIVPAERVRENVQLFIVNREDHTKICGVGEVCEIMTRAAGLAEISVLLVLIERYVLTFVLTDI